MSENPTRITNIRAYLLSTLYNAPSSMSAFYQAEYKADLYGMN